MTTITEALQKLSKNVPNLYIQRLTKNGNELSVYASDKYGNDFDMPPICIDINTGKELHMGFNFDASGINCEIPTEYTTYRSRVYDRIVSNIGDGVLDSLGEWGISIPINLIYHEPIADMTLSQIYAVCNYMVHVVALLYSDDERSSFIKLLQNERISSFLRLSNGDKLKLARNFYYIPDYVTDLQSLTYVLGGMARGMREAAEAGEISTNAAYENLKSNIQVLAMACREKLAVDVDEMCDVAAVGAYIDTLEIRMQEVIAASDEFAPWQDSGYSGDDIFGTTDIFGPPASFGEPEPFGTGW